MPILQITKDGIVLQEIEFQAERLAIGREPENEVRLGDLTVSRRHGELKRHANGRYFIADLKSRNGIFLNGNRLTQPAALTDGDQLKIGVYQIVFRDPAEITELRQTHINTSSDLSLEAEPDKRAPQPEAQPELGPNHELAPEEDMALKMTKPLGEKMESFDGKTAHRDHALEIGILINEANNAIFAIRRAQVVLGSDSDADIRVPGPPRTRAIIARSGDYFYICSDTPAPSVSVNERPVMNSRLVYNDRIEIGGRRFIFREI